VSSWDKQMYGDLLLTGYLLGTLSEEETERLDELSISDDEFAMRLSTAENDLVDSYVKGELSGETLEQFKSFYLSSPKRREKVRFAHTFLVYEKSSVEQERQPQANLPRSFESSEKALHPFSRLRSLAFPRVALQWGFAVAALLILLAGGYLLFENLRLRSQMTRVQAEHAALQQREQDLERQLTDQRTAGAEKAKELESVRESLAKLEQQLAANQQGEKIGPQSHEPNSVYFDLLPQTRGTGQIADITVPMGTDYVVLRLELESNDFPEYQVVLKNPATNQIIWRSGKLKAKSRGNNKTISISVRASLLKQRNYTLEASGTGPSGAAEFISGYPFRVVIQ
jgi:hypothetical protein